jgi:hypothetical protein
MMLAELDEPIVDERDPRIATADRLRELFRQNGPDCYRNPEWFAQLLQENLSDYPAEACAIAAVLSHNTVDEILQRRGTANPASYLPVLARELAEKSDLSFGDANWAVFTWHDLLADMQLRNALREESRSASE